MKCILCQRSNETTDTGALSSKGKVAAHQNCLCYCLFEGMDSDEYQNKNSNETRNILTCYFLLYASGLCCQNTPEFDDLFGFSVDDVKDEVNRGQRLLCHKCKKRGATAGCENGRCKKSYHYPCAVEDGVKTFEKEGMFGLYCPPHYLKNQKNDTSRNGSCSANSPEFSDNHCEAGPSKKRPSQSAHQSLPPAKRVLLDLERIIHQSSDSAGNDAEEDQSIFAPLESDIDEDSQEQETSLREATEDLKHSAGSDCKAVSANETSLPPAEKTDAGIRFSVIVPKVTAEAVNENEQSPEQTSVHSPLPHTGPGSSPVPNPTEAPSVGTLLPSTVSAPAESSNCFPAAPVPSIDSANFWKSCNEAGCTEAIFTSFIREMNDVAGRIQSDQASQEDYDLALSVMQASGKMITIVIKQHEEIQQKQMELDKAAASIKKVLSVLKR